MRSALIYSSAFFLIFSLAAQTPAHRLVFESQGPTGAPKPVPTQLGTDRAPDGAPLGANSQYLTRNGKPWVPVMESSISPAIQKPDGKKKSSR